MINAKYIRIIIGIIGNVLSTSIFLSPMPEFIQAYKKKSVEGVKLAPHLVLLIKCSLWVLYGLPLVHKDNILVTTSNGVGFVIQVIYVVVFWINCDEESRKDLVYICLTFEFCFVAAVYIITIWGFESSVKHTFVGVVCNVYNIGIIYLFFTIDKMPEGTKTFKYMPFWLSLVSFINAGIWTAYSLIYTIDIYVLISSGLETFLCAFQLLVYASSYTLGKIDVIV
ncbi:hypothetical protein ARALYDRAFT_920411 [Arabidopsis lyrata subsp. lyrata]|uniref:Bidirectional sugar transporter SWEET n=1 Tax=Arabidopsis lyrata subsp. lyrata TaxID=81972 RepID=D7MX11_ARALL|nr:bidirectional sugar transporter SWEET8 [Arabidopsis lyrata subsp. lyrata]EFH38920.1 hypothetical protein ARALYDRAFT_920411 [Arabidopsis lyrata subsp. lyrata]|eukprot:XP_002862662.1 bidirectional sugar transporter SWEET8 [Arabidopsis lyrata subsp. lyrata]